MTARGGALAGRWLAGVLVAFAFAALASAAGASTIYLSGDGSPVGVSAFSVGSNGGLSALSGSPFTSGIGTNPEGVAMTPDGRFLYVGDFGAATVSMFSVGANGALTPLPGSPLSTSASQSPELAVSPDGRFLYVSIETGNSVSAYSIGSSGALSLVGTYPSGGINPRGLAVTPDGRFLYVTNVGQPGSTAGNVSALSIGSSGALSLLGSFPTGGDGPSTAAVTPDGRFLYVTNHDTNNLSAFAIASNGTLGAVAGSPYPISGLPPSGVAVTPNGHNVYVAAGGSTAGSVFAFSVGAAGALTALGTATAGDGTQSVAVTPDGRFLYAADLGGTVSAFAIGSGGALGAIGSPIADSSTPYAVVVTPDQAPVAAFSSSAAPAGSASAFDGSGSHDPDGTVARYDWSFGDGASAQNAGPAPSHVYAASGTYKVTLTVTDDAGCSTAQTFTGQTVSCNGSGAAQISHQVTVLSAGATTKSSSSTTSTSSSQARQPAGGPKLELGSVTVAGARASVHLSCTGSAGGKCRGAIAFHATSAKSSQTKHKRTKRRLARAKKPGSAMVTVGKTSFKIGHGKSSTVTVKLNRAGRRLLSASYRLQTELAIRGTTAFKRPVTFAYKRVTSPVTWTWSYVGARTTVEQLDVKHIPRGGRVTLLCDGAACRAPRQSFKPKRRGRVALASSLGKRRTLPAGVKLQVRISASNSVAKVMLIATRVNKYPSVKRACLPPGFSRPTACAEGGG